MRLHHLALLAGLFLAPALLLWLGHGLRRRSGRLQRVFWGAVVGHVLAVLITLLAAMLPPVAWEGGAWWREAAVHWSMLLGAALGAAAALPGPDPEARSTRRAVRIPRPRDAGEPGT